MRLRAGMTIKHYDDDANGNTTIWTAKVIRARGLGLLVERISDGPSNGLQYRISRGDLLPASQQPAA